MIKLNGDQAIKNSSWSSRINHIRSLIIITLGFFFRMNSIGQVTRAQAMIKATDDQLRYCWYYNNGYFF
jgi:hypothetical protein